MQHQRKAVFSKGKVDAFWSDSRNRQGALRGDKNSQGRVSAGFKEHYTIQAGIPAILNKS
jgi:hypothetical protein